MLRRLRNRRARGRGSPLFWSKPSRAKRFVRANSTRSSIIWRIYPRHSTSARSIEAAVVSVDGFGDFSSAAWGVAAGCEISTLWPRLFSAFARHLLSGAHAISRLSALWRRVQGDGACALWPPFISRRHAENCAPAPRRRLRARSEILPPSSRGRRLSVDGWVSRVRRFVFARARGAAGAAARAERSARGSPSRHRPLGPGDV